MKGQMKRYFGLRGWAMFLAGAFVLSSCTEDEVVEKYAPNTDGEGISFCVYCFNIQPGIEIDYSTGQSKETE